VGIYPTIMTPRRSEGSSPHDGENDLLTLVVDQSRGETFPMVAVCGRVRLSDYGIRFVWKSGFLRPKARPMYGTAHAKSSAAG
jgi:hypothetical protein